MKKVKKALGLSEHETDRPDVEVHPVDPDKRRRALISQYGEVKGARVFEEEQRAKDE